MRIKKNRSVLSTNEANSSRMSCNDSFTPVKVEEELKEIFDEIIFEAVPGKEDWAKISG
jgi:hypothetical protein